jgi:homoserine O-acetyltransferase
MNKPLLASVLLILIAFAPVSAAPYPAPAEGDFTIHNFQFASGETLPELRLHYRTLGQPSRDASGIARNAVLVLHGTGGSSQQFLNDHFAGVLFGPDQLLDTRKYYIILPDSIGHGHSSKPSDGMHARFPHYTYQDMVNAQHQLLTEGLHVNHLRLVMGTSMGGMHTWVWGETYPDFMDALLPLASAPVQIAGRNRMMRRMVIDSIKNDPEWQQGEYAKQPRGLASALHILLIMSSCPLQLQKQAPSRDAADQFLEKQMQTRLPPLDANDLIYQFDSSREYNPEPLLDKIMAPLVAINSADDVINPPELSLMERAMPKIKHGRYILLPISDKTRGHGTHSYPEIWKEHLAELLESSTR